ncbi:MAG: hypothetical protein H6951_19415 [Zoogloeaceae bacterium]|nr:hypothetical protein [Zoogloeaceae bacterium]
MLAEEVGKTTGRIGQSLVHLHSRLTLMFDAQLLGRPQPIQLSGFPRYRICLAFAELKLHYNRQTWYI